MQQHKKCSPFCSERCDYDGYCPSFDNEDNYDAHRENSWDVRICSSIVRTKTPEIPQQLLDVYPDFKNSHSTLKVECESSFYFFYL